MAGPWEKFQKSEGPWTKYAEPRTESDGSMLQDIGSSIATGLRQGIEATVGGFGDVREMNARGIAWGAEKLGASPETAEALGDWTARAINPGTALAPTTGQLQEAVTIPAIGEHYEPRTTAGEYARTAGEFAPALATPGGPLRRLASTLVPALASETAGQATEGTAYEKYARAAAALVAGAPVAFFGKGAPANLVAKVVKGATPQQLDQAEHLFQEARTAGTPITRFEAVQQVTGGATRAADMQRVIEGQGGLREFYAGRPAQVEAAARRQFDAVTPPSDAPHTIGAEAGRTAESVIDDARGAINRTTEPYYTSASIERLSPAEFKRVEAAPGWAEARAAVRGDPQLARYVEGFPDDSVGFLNKVKKYLDTQAENAAGPVNAQRNMQRSAGYGSDAAVVRQAAERASPDYEKALRLQRELRSRFLDPILQGPIGKLAQKDQTTQDAINALFPRNPLPNSAGEIGRTVALLTERNPGVARQLVRSHIESTFNQAVRELQSGANQWGGAGFTAALRGNPQQRANLQAAVTALPNGEDLWKGFDRFLNILEAQGTRQRVGSQTAFNQEALQDLKAGNPLGTTAALAAGGGLQFPRRVMDVVDRWRLGRNTDQLANLITDERGQGLFVKLATARDDKARNLALTLVNTGNVYRRPSEKSDKPSQRH